MRLSVYTILVTCFTYDMDQQAYYRVSVKGVVINDDGRILLAKEGNRWEMLGGGLNHNEDPIACLKREIYEETGLEATYISPNPIYFITTARPQGDTFIANILYRIKLKDLAFVPSAECQELRFFNLNEMRQVELFPNVQKLRELLEEQQV